MTEQLQQEDTVSADRKIRIIIDPKTGKRKKTSAVTSRQNFDAEKFGNRTAKPDADEEIKEGTQIESLPANVNDKDGDTKADAKPKTKSSGAIEFVTGIQQNADEKTGALAKNPVATPVIPGYRKEETMTTYATLAEQIVKKALTQVKTDKNVGTEEIPFDGPYKKEPSTVVDKSGAKHGPMSKVRHLARQGMKSVKEDVEKIDELSSDLLGRYKKAASADASAADKAGNFKKGDKRFSGIVKATKKQFDNDAKSHPVSEARDDAYTRDYKSSVSGMGHHQSAAYHADGGANDEGWGNERHKPRSTMDRPHTVHIDGKPWKKFDNGHQAHAAAKTLQTKGKKATAIAHFKEEVELDEGAKGALVGAALGALATGGAALPTLAGAYIGHKIQQKKQKEAEKKQPKKSFKEAWEDMLKYAKEKNKPQPNGGSGKKQGTAYGGSKQKEEPAKEDE